VAGSCEDGNEPSSVINGKEFLDPLSDCRLIKRTLPPEAVNQLLTYLFGKLMSRYQYFGEIYCFHLQSTALGQDVPPERCYLPASPRSITTQKIKNDVLSSI
jgi:hypothetical protein